MMSRFLKLFVRLLLSSLPLIYFPELNVLLNRLLGYKLHKTVRIYSSVQIRGNIDVCVGENTFIGHDAIITGGSARISIGSYCDISDRVAIVCGTHEIDLIGKRSAGKCIGKDIFIDDGVWIGYGAIILPGVKIGKKAIIGAGAVVNKDVDAYSIVAGNPMRIIGKMESDGITTTDCHL